MSQFSFYYDKSAISRAVAKGGHRGIIGGFWDEIGRLQLDFLKANGLARRSRLIDVGCGCLRGGVHFVDFLDPGNYFGIDMSAELLQAGYDIELKGRGLCDKLPRSNLICNAEFDFSEFATTFDVAIAQSLFTHLPANVIELCLSRLAPHMQPDGVLFATFFIVPDDHPIGAPFTHPHGVRTFDDHDPYHYRLRQIRHLCDGLPWRPELVGEWGHPRDQQMVSLRYLGRMPAAASARAGDDQPGYRQGESAWRRPATEAFAAEASHRGSARWPSRANANRLEPECWPELRPSFKLLPSQVIFTIGSCFARNIEEYLKRLNFVVPTLDFQVPKTEWPAGRPNGILNKYTPPAIYQELERTRRYVSASPPEQQQQILEEALIEVGPGRVVDLELGGFVPVDRARAVERRRQVAELFRHAFTADVVTITFGLVECWYDTVGQRYIQQTPAGATLQAYRDRFEFRRLRFAEAYSWAKRAVELLEAHGKPDQRYLITVSPVPLQATFTGDDVIIANMYSKSLLRTVAEEIRNEFERVDYFASFESAMLTRRPDIWEDDLVHVTDRFVGKLVGRLVAVYTDMSDGGPPDVREKLTGLWALFDGGEIEQVLARAGQLRASIGPSPDLDVIEGIAWCSRGDVAKGGRLIVDAIGSASLSCARLAACAKALAEAGQYYAALGVWDRIADAPDADLKSVALELAQAANAASASRHRAYADKWIGRAVAVGGERPRVRQMQGLILKREGDLDGAIDAFRLALARADGPWTRYNLALVLQSQHKRDAALVEATKALSAAPANQSFRKLVDELRVAATAG